MLSAAKAIFNPADCLRIRWQVSVGETTFAKFSAAPWRCNGGAGSRATLEEMAERQT